MQQHKYGKVATLSHMRYEWKASNMCLKQFTTCCFTASGMAGTAACAVLD